MPYHPHLPARKIRLGDYTTGIPGETSSADQDIYQPAVADIYQDIFGSQPPTEPAPVYDGSGSLPAPTTKAPAAKASTSLQDSWRSVLLNALIGAGSIVAGSYVKAEGKYGIAAKVAFLGAGAYGLYRAYNAYTGYHSNPVVRVAHETENKITSKAKATYTRSGYISKADLDHINKMLLWDALAPVRAAQMYAEMSPRNGMETDLHWLIHGITEIWLREEVPDSFKDFMVALTPESSINLQQIRNAVYSGKIALIDSYTDEYPDPYNFQK